VNAVPLPLSLVEEPDLRTDLLAENERLLQLDQLKDELIATVSHELRTPLTSIVGYLELLHDTGPLTDQQAQFLGVIRRSAERLLSLISDLLLMAQVESDGMRLERENVDLAAIARECIAAVRPSAESRSIAMEVTAEPASVFGDRRLLGEVVDNLLSNAVKFTPEGGSIAVRVACLNDRVLLAVRDSGIGIPADEQKDLFARFYRTRDAARRAVPGSGLGLSIVKAIVDAHGGEVMVESAVSEGSTFRVLLPANHSLSAEERST
jgi:signal transduction histidine kinase